MSGLSKIEWCDATWNPVRGCSRVSEGCRNCYAERQAARFVRRKNTERHVLGSGERVAVEYVTRDVAGPFEGFAESTPAGPRWTGKVALVPEALDWPLRRRKPLRIFVNSMSDLFHEALPDEAIDRVFAAMALAPEHTFLILTKRAGRMLRFLESRGPGGGPHGIGKAMFDLRPAAFGGGDSAIVTWPLPNVWLGVSVEDQATADERIPLLLQTPAAHRFISAEPLLGPINLREMAHQDDWHVDALDTPDPSRRLDWVIVGGESGPGARPCGVDWIRSVVRDCKAASVPCFVKQAGRWVLGDDAGFRVNHWLLENGRGYVPPLIGEPARQRPPTRVCAVPAVGFSLFDRKGGDPAEWPEDLRVREVPA